MKKLILFLTILMVTIISAFALTDTITITASTANVSSWGTGYENGALRTWSQNGVSFAGKAICKNTNNSPTGSAANTNIQAQSGNGVIYNTTEIPGNIVSLTFEFASGGSAQPNIAYGGTAQLVSNTVADYTVNASAVAVTNNDKNWTVADFTTGNYRYFALHRGSSGTTYFTKIQIVYEVAGSGTEQVLTPSITPIAGNFTAPLSASITCATADADIFYTIDNFVNVNPYTAPFSVVATTTLKAWAMKSGMTNSDTATRVYTFPTSLGNVAAFNAAAVDAFVSIAGLSVIRHSGNNLWATDGTNAIHVYGLSASARAALNDGDVISLAGSRANYNGFPEMMSPVLLTSTSGSPVTPVADFNIAAATTADFGKFVTVKNVKFASTSALENGVVVTNQLMDLSGIDLQKTYNVTGVINYNNATLQFLPTAVAEVEEELFDCTATNQVYAENFNAVASGSLPVNWVSTNPTNYPWNVNAAGQLYCRYHNANVVTTVTSDVIDLSSVASENCIKLFFSHAEPDYSNRGDTLAVYYKIGANSPVLLGTYCNKSSTLAAAEIALPTEALVSDFRLVLEQRSSDANNTYVDNIFIGTKMDYDIQLQSFALPTISEGTNLVKLPVQVNFLNASTKSFTSTDTTFIYTAVDGVITSSRKLAIAGLSPGVPYVVTLDSINVSTDGEHTVKVWFDTEKDTYKANDSLTKTIINHIINYEAQLVSIISPVSGMNLGANQVVQVSVKNNGLLPITDLPLTLEVDGTTNSETVSGLNIAYGATSIVTMNLTADLSGSGDHTVRVWATLVGDNNYANDTVSKIVTNHGCSNTPYENLFTTSTDTIGIKILDVNADNKTWEYYFSGGRMRYANATVAADDWFITKCINLEAGKNYSVSFNYYGSSTTKTEKLSVYYGTEQSVAGMTDLIVDLPSITSTTNTQSSSTIISPTSSGVYYFGFHCYSAASQGTLNLDNVRIVEIPADEVQVLAITAPVASGISLSNAETVKVAVKNNGTNIITALDLTLEVDGNIVGTSNITGRNIAYNANDTLTLDIFADLSLAGDHNLRVWANLAGDTNHINDTVSKVVNNFIFACGNAPYENYFTDWRDTMGIKIFNVNNDNKTWTWLSAGYMQYSYHGTNAANDWFITKCINLESGKAYKLSFSYRPSSYPEKVAVAYGTEQTVAGMTNPLLDITTAGNTIWTNSSAILVPTTTGQYYIGFHCHSDANMNTLSIDSLRLVEYDMIDAALTAITEPVSGMNLSDAEIVKVKIKNNGSAPITSADMALVVDGATPVVEPFIGSIAAGGEYVFAFSTPLDLSAAGSTSLKAYITMTGDMDHSNDTVTATVVNTICNVETLPFEPDLANLSACWMTTGNDAFVLNPASTVSMTIPAHTGDFLGYNADGVGSDGKIADITLITPPIDCSAAAAVKLSFNYFSKSSIFDVKVSIDNAPFVLVQTLTNQPTQFYPMELNLAGAAGHSNVRVAFHYNETNAWGYGAGFQNVRIFAPAANDADVVSIVSPVSGRDLSAAETVKVAVHNAGAAAIAVLDLTLEVDGNVVGTTNLTGLNIAADATDTLTLTNTANLSLAGNHTIRVWADLAGDANQANDTVSKNVVNTVCSIISELPWEEQFNNATSLTCWTINSTVSATNSWKLKSDATGYTLYTIGYYNGEMFNETAISPEFDFTAYSSPVLSFGIKANPTWLNGTNSSLKVEVSVNGAAFTPIWSETNVTFEGSGAFKTASAEKLLTGCGSKSNVKFAFHYTGDDGAEVFIDNLQIIDNPAVVNQNLVDNNISVYPNPVKDVLTINGMDIKNAEIYDIAGKLVMSGINKNTIDVKTLNIGVYFLKVGNQVAKFVKE